VERLSAHNKASDATEWSHQTPRSTLTIGIPTFNRGDVACQRIANLAASGATRSVDVVVIDDASPDGTYDSLVEAVGHADVKVLRNPERVGYARNFMRLFDECQTEYLLVTSDDDVLVPERLPGLLALLADRAPLFVSTQFYVGGRLWRGRRATSQIAPQDFFAASAHAPGLAYNVAAVRKLAIPAVRARIEASSQAALVYPQLLLACLLLTAGTCLWWDQAVVVEGPSAETRIRDGAGRPYFHLVPRWAQVQDLLAFIDAEVASSSPSCAEAMRSTARTLLFTFLRSGIGDERPDLLSPFDDSARAFYSSDLTLRRLLAERARAAATRARSRLGRALKRGT
jgi:hypothetical protein